MTVSELAGALRGVSGVLERAMGTTAAAITPLEEARAALRDAQGPAESWYPVELDSAVLELARVRELVAVAKRAVDDYLARL